MSLEMILFDEIAMIANLDSNHDIVIIILMINNSQQAASKSKHHEFSPSIFMLTTKKRLNFITSIYTFYHIIGLG